MRSGVLLMAKAPVAGLAKTRLGAAVGDEHAADLAAAALLDTLDACESAWPVQYRVIAMTGDLARAARSDEIAARLRCWRVIPQTGSSFGQRLVYAHQAAAALLDTPVIQLGMDTPQIAPADLHGLRGHLETGGYDGVIGPALDGGWWALGLNDPKTATVLGAVPMSTRHTGRDTVEALARAGARLWSGNLLRDVDEVDDAGAVAADAPRTRFAETWRGLPRDPGGHPDKAGVAEIFNAALAGAPCQVLGLPGGPRPLPVRQWQGACSPADRLMVDRCVGTTLDIGCGPGRLTEALARRGLPALGIDLAPLAIQQTRARGVMALRRDVFAPLPGEGRWQSAVLADGNIGIGGSPRMLLRRLADVVVPSGLIVVETAEPSLDEQSLSLELEANGQRSEPFGWALIGLRALAALAESLSMCVLDAVAHDGRWFLSLANTPPGSRRHDESA